MSTFTYPTDQKRLQRILSLDASQLLENSMLQELMMEAESLDAEDSMDRVSDIISYMDEIDTPSTGLTDQQASDTSNLKKISVAGEYSAEYAAGGKSLRLAMQMQTAKQNILKLLDPLGLLHYDRFKRYPYYSCNTYRTI